MPKKAAALPAPAAPAAPTVARFAHLVSTMAVAARSEALLSAEPLAKAAPEIQAAWERLIRPERLVALLMHHNGEGIMETERYRGGYGHDNQAVYEPRPPSESLLPLLSDEDCSLIAAGLRQCAQDIQAAASSPAFDRVAKLHSALIALPSADEANPSLAYPLMGLALRPAKVLSDSKRVESLSASWLARAGDAQTPRETKDRNGYDSRWGRALSPVDWLSPAELEPVALASAHAALEAAREVMPESQSHNDDSRGNQVRRFAAVLKPSAGPAALSGDAPLPSVALVKKAIEKDTERDSYYYNPPLIGAGAGQLRRAEIAESKGRAAAAAIRASSADALALSIARANPGRTLGQELSSSISLSSGPLSQAFASLKGARGFDADRGQRMMDIMLEGNTRDRGSRDRRRDLEKAMEQRLERDKLDKLMADIAKASAKADADAFDFASVGGSGRGLVGLSKMLGDADPRVGLIQWASSSFKDIERLRGALSRRDRYLPDGETPPPPMALPPAREEIASAVEAARAAIEQAADAFARSAVEEAQRVEAEWLERRALLAPWRQAEQTGALNSQTLAWAMANPASGLLASSNPMLELGARCAKAWGLKLSEPLDEADFLERFRGALEERGAQEQAQAALAESPALRETVAGLARLASEPEKEIAGLAHSALAFTLRLAQRAAASGMPAEQIAQCCAAYAEFSQSRHEGVEGLSHFATARYANSGLWDGFGPELAPASLANEASARLVSELSSGKAAHYDQFLDALADDWRQTSDASAQAGADAGEAAKLARERAKELIARFPRSRDAALDWRQPVFSDPAWSVLGYVSPRFSAAIVAASAQGELGAWCAKRARGLGIRDAVDGNDLIGKTREAIKAATGLSDGAWKQMIKTPKALDLLAHAMGLAAASARREARGEDNHSTRLSKLLSGPEQLILSKTRSEPPAPSHYRSAEERAASSMGEDAARLFTMAARLNLSMPSVVAAAEALLPHSAVFGSSVGALEMSGEHGAQFYLQELQAKQDRAPYVLKEAAKRFEKFERDALTPPPEGEVAIAPAKALLAEVQDLADWIGQSEPGLWQTLPAQPTWNQLRRASGEWHAEQAAMARDKHERQLAKAERDRLAQEERQAREEQRRQAPRNAPRLGMEGRDEAAEGAYGSKAAKKTTRLEKMMGDFANAPGAGWPKVLGRHARDGWQAVELLTADALQAEGAAMSHCVSSYSGQCRSGDTRIFSILLNDERVCTVQISGKGNLADLNESAEFHIVQNKGKANKSITSKAALDFCEETRAMVQSSWRALCQKRRVLRDAEEARERKEEAERKAARKAELLGEPAPAPAPEPAVGEKLKARRSSKASKAEAIAAPGAG